MLKYILSAAPVLALAACESTVPGHPRGISKYAGHERLGEPVKRICFNESLDRFRQTEKQSVIVRDSTRQEYVVEVKRTCTEMRNAGFVDIEINEKGGYCLAPGENLLVSTTAAIERARLGLQRCEIVAVSKWKSLAEVKAEEAAAPPAE